MFTALSQTPKSTVDKPPIRIAIEGIDGSGKSTQVTCVSKSLLCKGYKVEIFRYTASRHDIPGMLIRKLYKTKHSRQSLIGLVSKNRILQESLFVWQASLNLNDLCQKDQCRLILCDRCAVTSYAAHITDPSKSGYWETLLSMLESKFVPDYVIYLQVPISIAITRLSSRGGFSNDENINKLHQITNNYKALVSGEWAPGGLRRVKQWLTVNGDQDQGAVRALVEGIIEKILEEE